MTDQRNLPPLVDGYTPNGVSWRGLESVEFDLVGYLLACHLVIEHYIDHFLIAYVSRKVNWDDARLQFWQKIALLESLGGFESPYDFIPAIKHLNALRNRLAHKIETRVTLDDVAPLSVAVEKCTKEPPTFENVHAVLELFTSLTCAYFAGAISYSASAGRKK